MLPGVSTMRGMKTAGPGGVQGRRGIREDATQADAEVAASSLVSWYAVHARDLPWRRRVDPYRVLVSEIMLQQTTVETVIPYYEAFLAAFPSVRDLAGAEVGEVLALWSGLGYYRRARSLHAAAGVIVRELKGIVPERPEDLLALPGIGRYTASAIRAIAYHKEALALDGNLRRVLARWTGYRGDPARAEGDRILTEAGMALVRRGDPSALNQALMDVGATICSPLAPRCLLCPLAETCRARRLGIVDSIPPPRIGPDPIPIHLAAVVLKDRGSVLLQERRGRLMQGMWEFPMIAVGAGETAATAIRRAMRRLKIRIDGDLLAAGSVTHAITRHRMRIDLYEGSAAAPGRTAAKRAGGAAASARERPRKARSSGPSTAPEWRVAGPPPVSSRGGAALVEKTEADAIGWKNLSRLGEIPLTGVARKILGRLATGRPERARRGKVGRD